MDIFKQCFRCKEVKCIDNFYSHPKMADGHLNKCIECTKKDTERYRKNNSEKVKLYDRYRGMLPHRVDARKKYRLTKVGKEAFKRASKKYIQQHPDRRAANVILGNTVRDKRIQKEPCEICNSIVNIHGHHEDYSKPLDVIWMCVQCHKDHHFGKVRYEA